MRTIIQLIFLTALTFSARSVLAQADGAPVPGLHNESAAGEIFPPRVERSPDRFVRRLTVEGGLASISYEGPQMSNSTTSPGSSVGILFDLGGRQNLVLETGAIYRQVEIFSQDDNYVSIPLSGKYYFGGQDQTTAYLKAGAMGSTLTSNNATSNKRSTKPGSGTWETAFIAGLGMQFNFTPATNLILEGGYTRTFDSVVADSSVFRSDLSAILGMSIAL